MVDIEEIASRDAYQVSMKGRVLESFEDGVVLDRTVFYARGGGQPGDFGVIRCEGEVIPVIDTVRKDGKVFHVFGDPHPLEPGMVVDGAIDWHRRHKLMRTHTALHALSAVIYRDFGAKVTGGNMEPGSARMDFELEGISQAFGGEVEDRLNKELAKDHQVTVEFLPREVALADPELIRTKVNLIPEWVKEIRVVTIGDLDRQADGGTHVRSTSSVGPIRVTKTESKGRLNKRMRIELEG